MGLTRYWYRPPVMEEAAFREWAADCRTIIESASLPAGFRPKTESESGTKGQIVIRGPDGHGEPVVSDHSIALNGDASTGLENEPFHVEKSVPVGPRQRLDEAGRVFEYCKTGGKPYDTVVDACLIAMQNRFGSVVAVDADSEAKRLDAGQKLYAATFSSD